uniref:proteasome endopeptidase complex n=1 Tax=Cyprinus carpio TaxID=7962 RepID=A0A8C1VSQ2_CYPCA
GVESNSRPDLLSQSATDGRYEGGVVIGSDSRASKCSFFFLMFCCMAGSLADAQAVTNAVIHQLSFHSMQMEEPPLVKSAAAIMRSFCYTHQDELSARFIMAGWDHINGPQVFTVSLGGIILEQEFTVGGSGSSFIYGYADAKFKPGMTREECLTSTTNALTLAMDRDNVSGVIVHLAIVTEKGAERQLIPGNKLCVKFFCFTKA